MFHNVGQEAGEGQQEATDPRLAALRVLSLDSPLASQLSWQMAGLGGWARGCRVLGSQNRAVVAQHGTHLGWQDGQAGFQATTPRAMMSSEWVGQHRALG